MQLLIITTPFQCWIAIKLIKEKVVTNYEVLYLTRNNSIEDQHYFMQVSEGAIKAKYVYRQMGGVDIIKQFLILLELSQLLKKLVKYECIYLASIDAIIPSYIVARFKGKIITFDDGSANINQKSSYWMESLNTRTQFYKKLLRCATLTEIKNRVVAHYTIYENEENIVSKEKIKLFKNSFISMDSKNSSDDEIVVFIGQPFSEMLTSSDVEALKNYLHDEKINYYMVHPREKIKIIEGIKEFPKKNLIAEEAILNLSVYSKITLVGSFSSVLININHPAIKKIMILFESDPKIHEYRRLASKNNCEIKYL